MELVKPKEQSEYSKYNLTPEQITTAKNLYADMGEEAVIFGYSAFLIVQRKLSQAWDEIECLKAELERVRA